ncbi:MAG: WGR domain-containing protein [Sphingomonadales bacterium]|nr:WGR domain-containing protein [Sphingomonadales bacterium]
METPKNQSWHWQAIDPSRNVARDYHLWVETDLFGWTTVERRWGRIGTKGRG